MTQVSFSPFFFFRCLTICTTSVNVSPLACNYTVSLSVRAPCVIQHRLCPCWELQSQTKRLLIELDCWAFAPAGRLQLRDRDNYWVWGIYRTSGWASSFSPSPSPPICLCGFIKGTDGLSETGLHCCGKIHSLHPEVWQSLCKLHYLPLKIIASILKSQLFFCFSYKT